MDYKKYIIFIPLFSFFLAACFAYSFKGSLPSNIKNVAIPLFDDNTAYPGVREDLTNSIIDEFIADNTLAVTPESDADIIITGTISSIRERAAIITGNETVEEIQMYVTVRAKCEDIKNQKIMWEKNISEFGVMEANGSQEDRDRAIQDALVKITEDILNNTLANW